MMCQKRCQPRSEHVACTTWLRAGVAGVLLGVLGGCQQYERQPLDLNAHRASVHERAEDVERMRAFLTRWLKDASRDTAAIEPAAFSLDDGVSAAEAEALAMFYNGELRMARMEAGAALATYETAGLWSDPVFSFDGAEILSASAPFEYGLMLSLTIPISGRLAIERDRAGAAYEAALRDVVDAEWRTRMEVRRTWAHLVSARERLHAAREALVELESLTAITDRLHDAGELSNASERIFTIALAQRRAEAYRLETSVRELEADARFLIGLSADAPVVLDGGTLPIDLPADSENLDDALIARNTQLAVQRARYQVAEETLRLEVRKQFPDIELGGGYGNEGDDRLLLGVSIPVPILNANRAGIAEARAARQAARAAAETTFERLRHELHRAMLAHEQATTLRTAFATDMLTLADTQFAELQELAELGELDTLLLFEAIAQLFEARDQLLVLHLDEQLAAIRIAELLGPATVNAPAPVAEGNES